MQSACKNDGKLGGEGGRMIDGSSEEGEGVKTR